MAGVSSRFLCLVVAVLLPVCCQAGFFETVENFIGEVEEGAKTLFGATAKENPGSEEIYGRKSVIYTFTSMTDFWAFGSKTNAMNGPKNGDILILKNGVYYDAAPTDYSGNCGPSQAATSTGGGWCITSTNVTFMAETNGGVIWKPRSPGVYLNFQGDGNNLKGFQFRDALSMAYGTLINTDGNGNQFNNLYFFNVSAAHYIKLNMNSKYNLIQGKDVRRREGW